MNQSMDETMRDLANTAMRVKEERDEAVRLLKEGLLYQHIGAYGSYKSRVREFLIRLRCYPTADDAVKREQLARHEGRPEHDLDTCGRPLKAGS
jgi:hypothetical protein